jgi:nucleoid DNA-binding protein
MKRAELVKRLSLEMDVTRKEAELYVVAFLSSIMESFYEDERVVFNGFGSFKIKKHKAWIARNQITGELVKIPVRNKISFHPGKELRERVNTIEIHGTKEQKNITHGQASENILSIHAG